MLIKVLTIPEDRNVFVVGDIHGMYDLFITTLKKMNFNFERDLCISVGDLVDRGEQSQQCVSLLDEPWFEAAEGNHEHFCVQGFGNILYEIAHKKPRNGGAWFYQLERPVQEMIISKFKELPTLIELHYRGKKYGFVHADVPILDWDILKDLLVKGIRLFDGRTIQHYCLWNRGLVKLPQGYPVHVNGIDHVFLGHTVVPEITRIGNCTFLDTGAVFAEPDEPWHLTVIKL